ncbi:MAG TPA: M48 family peptidase, partial [Flavobacteriales bacterium]|nr:M48 family peptidase [Flavobacteriales bacterium]
MADDLSKARGLVESVRYSGDTLKTEDLTMHRDNDGIDSYFSLNSILISPLVTPEISNSVDKVVSRLSIPEKSIKAYVYASSDIQAECHAGNNNDCIIRLSSGLIDILEYEEIEFVIGHEIGHFLYSHGLALSTAGGESLELSIQKRAQEISADRVGLLASESLDVSIRALMKTMSGLSSKYLKFDIGGFLSQLSNSESFKSQVNVNSSHPSMLVRCRALLWFSMCGTFKKGSQDYQANEVDTL